MTQGFKPSVIVVDETVVIDAWKLYRAVQFLRMARLEDCTYVCGRCSIGSLSTKCDFCGGRCVPLKSVLGVDRREFLADAAEWITTLLAGEPDGRLWLPRVQVRARQSCPVPFMMVEKAAEILELEDGEDWRLPADHPWHPERSGLEHLPMP